MGSGLWTLLELYVCKRPENRQGFKCLGGDRTSTAFSGGRRPLSIWPWVKILQSPLKWVVNSPTPKWVWLKITQEGLRRFWSIFPLTRVPFWNSGFLSSQMVALVLTHHGPFISGASAVSEAAARRSSS